MMRLACSAVFCLWAACVQALAADVTLAWDANTEPDIAGYRVYYGSDSRTYTSVIDVGNMTTYVVSDLGVGTYYFAVTAYNTAGLESAYSNEVSELIPAQMTLYLPHLCQSPSDTATQAPELTVVALTNYDAGQAVLTLTAYGQDGTMISGPDIINPVNRILTPGAQVRLVESELFGPGLSSCQSIVYIKIESTSSRISNLLMISDASADGLNAALAFPLATAFFPESQESGAHWFQIANPTATPSTVTFQLLDSRESVLTSVLKSIDSNSVLVVDAFADLFPEFEISESMKIRAAISQGVMPFKFLHGTSYSGQTLNSRLISDEAVILYAPQFVAGGPWRTTISVANLDQDWGVVTYQLFSDDGTELGSPQSWAIAPMGSVSITEQSCLVSESSSITQGHVRITSSGVRLAGSVLFTCHEQSPFATLFPLVSTLSRSLVFNQLAPDADYYTGVAIVNPTDWELTGTIEVYDADGRRLSNDFPLRIPAHGRSKGLLSDYFPGLAFTTSGYIRINADTDFASYALFGTINLTALFMIPTQIPK